MASKAGLDRDIKDCARRRRAWNSSAVIGWTRSPSGLRVEKAGGVCVCGRGGVRAAADAAAVEWRKLRREMGVMGYEDERRRKRSKEVRKQRRKRRGEVRYASGNFVEEVGLSSFAHPALQIRAPRFWPRSLEKNAKDWRRKLLLGRLIGAGWLGWRRVLCGIGLWLRKRGLACAGRFLWEISYVQGIVQSEVEASFGRDFYLLAVGQGLHGGAAARADSRTDCGSFAAPGKAADDGAEHRATPDDFGGALAARAAFLLHVTARHLIRPALISEVVERNGELAAALEFSRGAGVN